MRDELLRSRCTARDWEIWQEWARVDAVWGATQAHQRRVITAIRSLEMFCAGPRGYVGISWGKDSTAVMLLCERIGIDWPLVHVVIEPVQHPDNERTRDAWFARYPKLADRYTEIRIRCVPKPSTGRYDTNAAYAQGFAECTRRFGTRYVSGVRADESGIRKMTVRRLGLGDGDDRTARPLGHWRGEDVFAFLREEPLSPAYPCSMAGGFERRRVRVNNLWGLYGEEFGRREHEEMYYARDLRRIEAQHRADVDAARSSRPEASPTLPGTIRAGNRSRARR